MIARVAQSLANMDSWFETMRQAGGYAGPVSHIWRPNFFYCGPMLDWRYEGIVLGYINLYKKTGQQVWLDRAKRAGSDLVNGQYPCGNFKNSSFEKGAASGGTPHEASADIALLGLAKLLKETGDFSWHVFYETASRNIENYLINQLWTGDYFCDLPGSNYYVTNKSATILETLLLYHDILSTLDNSNASNTMSLIQKTAEGIISLQLPEGGIAHSSIRRDCHTFYTARCLWPLVRLHQTTQDERYLAAAEKIGGFILKMSRPGGGFYQTRYHNGKIGKYPVWVAACGDILYALMTLQGSSANYDEVIEKNVSWILENQDTCGGIRTTFGFGTWLGMNKDKVDFRDVIHVCGWNDKAFRLLSHFIPEVTRIPEANTQKCQVECVFNNRPAIYFEDKNRISVFTESNHKVLYHWDKKLRWANLPAFHPIPR
jgi:hypothetical protein